MQFMTFEKLFLTTCRNPLLFFLGLAYNLSEKYKTTPSHPKYVGQCCKIQ